MSIEVDKVRLEGKTFSLNEWCLYKICGEDAEIFFNGQTTNNLEKLKINEFQLSSRITRQGRVIAFFLLGKSEKNLWLIIPKERELALVEDLEKFIIMDDVTLEKINAHLHISFGPHAYDDSKLQGSFYGEMAGLNWSEIANDFPAINEIEDLRLLSGFPQWGLDLTEKSLLNETMLETLAIDYKKGCFLGQETVAKIHNGRGGSYFPVLLRLNSKANLQMNEKLYIENKKVAEVRGHLKYHDIEYLKISLLRDYRVVGKKLSFTTNNDLNFSGDISYLPFFKASTKDEKSIELYDKAVELFHKEESEKALSLLRSAISLKPDFADAIEIMGVIFGQLEKYEKGLEVMDELLAIDPSSVMAHTNKSFFYMRLGKIEDAEEEKSKATVKSFQKFGEEAKVKKVLEDKKKQDDADIRRRESMFLQVLEIDEDDTIANYGMGDICYSKGDFILAKGYLEKVLDNDKKYSMAYLVLGKVLESLNEFDQAADTYLLGIEIASKQGNMMPANEMQSRYSKLSK